MRALMGGHEGRLRSGRGLLSTHGTGSSQQGRPRGRHRRASGWCSLCTSPMSLPPAHSTHMQRRVRRSCGRGRAATRRSCGRGRAATRRAPGIVDRLTRSSGSPVLEVVAMALRVRQPSCELLTRSEELSAAPIFLNRVFFWPTASTSTFLCEMLHCPCVGSARRGGTAAGASPSRRARQTSDAQPQLDARRAGGTLW